jgi:Protease inhibitor Inh
MMSIGRFTPVLLVFVLTGCGSLGAIGLGSNNRPPPANLESAAPLPPVETANLPPPPDGSTLATYPPDGTTEPLPQPGADTEQTASASTGGELGRTDLLGGWTIAASGDSCQLFMTLTSWTGGYRASTRGCNSELLKSISAWNLQGSQVVLASQGGTEVARLNPAGGSRFDGQSVPSGAPVSFYR